MSKCICIITIAILLIFFCFLYFAARTGNQNEDGIAEYIGENMETVSGSTESVSDSTGSNPEADSEDTEVLASAKLDSSAKYVILARNGSLVVFYSDGTTEYFDTGIDVMSLPDETIDQVVAGITFATEEELFAFLESYSS